MTTRTDFTPEQWQALRNAPQLVALATAAAGNSGLFGSLSEGMATASSIAEAVRGDHPLLKEVFGRDEIRVSQEEIRAMIKGVPDKATLNTKLQESAASTIKVAVAALTAKGATADVDVYRKLLGGIAHKVANASKEGGFLGFGGERVSEGEGAFIAKLQDLLGTKAGAYQAEVKVSFFDRILEKLGIKSARAATVPPATPSTATPGAAKPAAAAPAAPTPIAIVDVVAQLEKAAAASPQKLNWKVSIVDLLKLLDIDSSFDARQALATELGIPVELMSDSAKMNIWLHKAVLKKIADNGGNIPKDLLD
jgi:hypothetical protein